MIVYNWNDIAAKDYIKSVMNSDAELLMEE